VRGHGFRFAYKLFDLAFPFLLLGNGKVLPSAGLRSRNAALTSLITAMNI